MVIILIESVNTTHAHIVLPDNVRLRHMDVILGSPDVAGPGGNRVCPQDVAHRGHWHIVVPSQNNLGLVQEDCCLKVTLSFFLKASIFARGGLPFSRSLWMDARNHAEATSLVSDAFYNFL